MKEFISEFIRLRKGRAGVRRLSFKASSAGMVAMLLLIAFSAFPSLSCSGVPRTGLEEVVLANVPTELNALVYIAETKRMFARNGMNVQLKENYESGASAAAGVLRGEADIALAAEFPIVHQVFNGQDIIAFGTITRYENTYIICRIESGIVTVADLEGKTIGLPLRTITEFYLGRTLDLNGMDIGKVSLVDINAPECENAIIAREVDAVAVWEPWVTQIQQRMGHEVLTMPLQSGQYAYWNLVGTSGWIEQHPDTVKRMMTALAQAQTYLANHGEAAKSIVRAKMEFDEAYMDILWDRYQFVLALDQSFITAMEDEARWMIANDLAATDEIPDFLDYIDEEGLRDVKPEAVTIIR